MLPLKDRNSARVTVALEWYGKANYEQLPNHWAFL